MHSVSVACSCGALSWYTLFSVGSLRFIERGGSDGLSVFEGATGDRCGDAEGRLRRARSALAPCPSLACPTGPGEDAGPLTWALSTGLPAEDGDHHLRREGAATGQRLCEGAEYVPGPPTAPLFPPLTSCICHHYDQTDLHPPDKVQSTCQPGLSRIF